MSGRRGSRRPSLAEQRERRGAVEDPAVVLDAAARFLEARPRSVGEVRRRLVGAGYQAALVEAAIVRLGELGMLDDEVFARAWVESRDRARPRGARALRAELRLKGLDQATIDGALAERGQRLGAVAGEDPDAVAAEPDLEAARRLLERSARVLARVDDPRRRRERAYTLLARHGFDAETCRDAIGTWAIDAED